MARVELASKRYYISCLTWAGIAVGLAWWMANLDLKWMTLNVSAEGGPDPYFGGGILIAFALLGALAGVFAGAILCGSPESRPRGARVLLVSLCLLSVYTVLRRRQPDIRGEAFRAAGERLMPLIHAIEAYKVDHGAYPDKLARLVPNHISKIPGTGMGSYPKLEYKTAAMGPIYDRNPYMLRIPAGYGMGWDEFIYLPSMVTPHRYPGGSLRPLGKWWYSYE